MTLTLLPHLRLQGQNYLLGRKRFAWQSEQYIHSVRPLLSSRNPPRDWSMLHSPFKPLLKTTSPSTMQGDLSPQASRSVTSPALDKNSRASLLLRTKSPHLADWSPTAISTPTRRTISDLIAGRLVLRNSGLSPAKVSAAANISVALIMFDPSLRHHYCLDSAFAHSIKNFPGKLYPRFISTIFM